MDVLQSIDAAQLPYIAAGCALLCVVVVVIGIIMQAVSSFFDVFVGFAEVIIEILQGGPMAWCGCVLVIFACIGLAGGAFLLLNAPESCAAHPTNFCRWFGFLN